MSKSKIAFVISGLGSGGAQTMLKHLVLKIDPNKFDFCIFVRGNRQNNALEQELEDKGVPVEFLSISPGGSIIYKLKAYSRFRKAIDKFNPDVLHCHLELTYSFWYAIHRGKKLIFTIHSWPDRIINKKFTVYTKILSKHQNFWAVGCTMGATQRLINQMPYLKSTSIAIYNPISTANYHHLPTRNEHLFTFIHVGRLTAIKNQKLLLEAFSDIRNAGISAQLIICGDGELRKELEKNCNELNISQSVKMLGNRDDIPDLLAKSDVFVLSSDSECCPMSIIEALASGIPLITTDVGGTREVTGKAGICVEKGNRQQLAEAMKRLTEDPVLYRELADNTHKEIEKFKEETVVRQYEELYDKVLGY